MAAISTRHNSNHLARGPREVDQPPGRRLPHSHQREGEERAVGRGPRGAQGDAGRRRVAQQLRRRPCGGPARPGPGLQRGPQRQRNARLGARPGLLCALLRAVLGGHAGRARAARTGHRPGRRPGHGRRRPARGQLRPGRRHRRLALCHARCEDRAVLYDAGGGARSCDQLGEEDDGDAPHGRAHHRPGGPHLRTREQGGAQGADRRGDTRAGEEDRVLLAVGDRPGQEGLLPADGPTRHRPGVQVRRGRDVRERCSRRRLRGHERLRREEKAHVEAHALS